ncbi:hypothetical protein H2200_008358 [Cladophialophora chaetospira]|uniref:NACHT domain-containing protein n=1 Tax=Cladophialophora chaetospira TaxID=386627 RepID=A0AA39CGE3_9EURO|nr:hypothetical protein H2200_008358 [Cladophialophora chaetospira]
MSTPSTDVEAQVLRLMWRETIKYYNKHLASNQKDKILEKSVDDPASPTCGLGEFIHDVESALSTRYGPAPKQKGLYDALQNIQLYASIGDVMIQHQPHITALIWGAARLLLQVAVEGVGLRFHIAAAVSHVLQKFDRCRKEAILLRNNPEAFNAVVRLQAHTLNYLFRARAYCKRRHRITFRLLGDAFQRKFASLWSKVERADQELASFIRTHQAVEQVEFRTGVGKTVLASWLAQRLSQPAASAHIYSRSNARGALLPQSLLLAAIVQLLRARQCLVEQLKPAFWDNLQSLVVPTHFPLQEIPCPLLFTLLTEVLKLLPSSVLIFDGLDECPECPAATQLFESLLSLKADPNIKTKIVLLSQRTPFLDQQLQVLKRLDLCANTMSGPIEVYVRKRVEENQQLQDLHDDIIRTVVEGAQGLFLWARLMLDSLENADSIMQQRALLQEPPSGLMDMYQRRWDEHQQDLGNEQIKQRDEVLLLLAGHTHPVDLDVICEALVLFTDPTIPAKEKKFFYRGKKIKQLCGSFVEVSGNDVQFSHSSARLFIERLHRRTNQNPYEYLLRISLSKLRELQYRDWRTCLRLLWMNIFGGEKFPKELDFQVAESALYNHACLNWQTYVTHLSRLPDDLVEELRSFILGNEFVTWSENLYLLRNKSGLEGQLNVVIELRQWYEQLDQDTRPELPISTIFIEAHESLSRDLEQNAGNVLARFLPLMRLGWFLSLAARSFGDLQQDLDYKTTVAEGFLRYLGERDPITLQAQLAMYADYLWKGPYDFALERIQAVYDIQREVLGEDAPDLIGTRTMIAGAYYRLGQLREAARIFQEVLERILTTMGGMSKAFLAGELFLGEVNEFAGNVQEATRLFRDVEKKWVDKNGKTSPFAAALFTGFGSIYRRQNNFDDAAGYLIDAWSQRVRIQTTEHPLCVDSALQLAVLYRDASKPEMARDFLNEVANSSVFGVSFERVCQRTHIQAMLLFDAGEYTEPRNNLQALILSSIGEDREKNNRELLWVRLNLAEAMRRHDEADGALMLFTELVTPIRDDNSIDAVSINTLHDEPEPVHQLQIAETGLRLIRDGRYEQADNLLLREGLAWVRPQDFWIIFGGPMADTATMHLRPPATVSIEK